MEEAGRIQKKKVEEEKEKKEGFNPNKLMDIKNYQEPDIEAFHDEYSSAYGSEKDHFNMLKEMHYGVTQTYMNEFVVLNTDSDTHVNKEYLLMRFGVLGVDLDKFVKGKDVGDIIKEKNAFKQKFLEKDKTQVEFNSFTHVPQFMEYLLTYGKNYAVISPMDLNIILNYTTKGEKQKDGPINIHIFEGCPFSYAKGLIILDMLKRKVSPHFLIQVWYSSAWSNATDKEFLISCENVIKHLEEQSEAKTILEHWLTSESVPLQDARDKWLKEINIKRHLFYCLKNKKDRLEVMRYLLTGEILITHVGSRTMFLNPLTNYKRANDENFIHAINLLNVTFTENSTFLSCVISHLIKKVKLVQEELEKNTMTVTLFMKEICPKEEEYISSLKANNYWIVFWANISDYFSRENFHKMGKAISTSETVHSLYSVYWFQEVFGTEIYDFHSSSRRSLMEKVNYAMERGFQAISYTSLSNRLREKPIANLQQKYLFTSKIMFKEKWADYYFECLNRSKQLPYLSYFGLTSMDTVIYLTFSYNNNIKLRDGADYFERAEK
jgi:hypothetical protein